LATGFPRCPGAIANAYAHRHQAAQVLVAQLRVVPTAPGKPPDVVLSRALPNQNFIVNDHNVEARTTWLLLWCCATSFRHHGLVRLRHDVQGLYPPDLTARP
jgi:hypothetical protein